jgi:hypothetical protein
MLDFLNIRYILLLMIRNLLKARHWWLTPISLATQEAEIRRIMIQSLTGQIILKTLSQKNPSQKELVEWLKV